MQGLVSKKSFNPNFVQFCGNVFRLSPLLPFYWKTRDNQAIEVRKEGGGGGAGGDVENTKSLGGELVVVQGGGKWGKRGAGLEKKVENLKEVPPRAGGERDGAERGVRSHKNGWWSRSSLISTILIRSVCKSAKIPTLEPRLKSCANFLQCNI